MWRKLQRYGAIPLGNSGYLLPNDPTTQERFEWLATAIRKYRGEASVVKVQSIDNLSTPQLVARFAEARARDYQELIRELQKLVSIQGRKRMPGRLSRFRARFLDIAQVDFFNSPLQKRVEELLARADTSPAPAEETVKADPREYVGRAWVTRPRPGIDRSASAWLIQRFIDKEARFIFSPEDHVPREAVPYDMFHGGFGHRGEDCTFETLQKQFRIRDQKVRVIGEIIHDADLLDEKFGRKEGFGIDEVLNGWAKQGIPDDELLKRGIQLIEALYRSVSGK
ncbi:MAG: chromate resistance protein ChrB domain-containing protein [Candidatus Dormibacteria bacterium]